MRLPNDSDRLAIIGSTGSGKTQAALWHLSHRNFHQMPWVVYNFKYDESIEEIPHHYELPLDEVPTSPGIWVTHPMPHEEDAVEAQMWGIWQRGNTGVYVDEGYMIGRNNKAFRSLLTQGRSKRIPMIVLSQRPLWMDKFVFTESGFFQVFRMQHSDDVKHISRIVPAEIQRLPEYHSYYYDVGRNETSVLRPVPEIDVIHSTFERRLRNQKRAM